MTGTYLARKLQELQRSDLWNQHRPDQNGTTKGLPLCPAPQFYAITAYLHPKGCSLPCCCAFAGLLQPGEPPIPRQPTASSGSESFVAEL